MTARKTRSASRGGPRVPVAPVSAGGEPEGSRPPDRTSQAEPPVAIAAEPIPVGKIRDSSTNPRRRSDPKHLEELIASVREKGVLMPILVRPVESKNGVAFEVVAGHRRLAAARAAGLEAVTAVSRELSDQEALEIQVIENLHRDDLHPLEEAEGYEQLIKRHGYQVEQLAERVGKSKAYVYARIKLCALVEMPRQAFFDGKIDASTALAIARVPGPLQPKATKEILEGGEWAQALGVGGHGRDPDDDNDDPPPARIGRQPMTYRNALAHLQRNYMLRLQGAPFDGADATLVPKAGACGACPKRTGNQPDLFGDVRGADVCTDPVCFRGKCDAAWERRATEAEKKGFKVLSKNETKRVFEEYGSLRHNAPFVSIEERTYDFNLQGKSLRQALGKHLPPPVLARDPNGRVHELLRKSDVPKVLKESGFKVPSVSSRTASPDERRRRVEALRKAARARAQVEAIVVAVEKRPDQDLILELMFRAVLEASWHDVIADVVRRRHLTLPKEGRNGGGGRQERALTELAATFTGKDRRARLAGLVVELIASRGAYGSWGRATLLGVAAKSWKVDAERIGAKAERAHRTARTQKAKPARRKKK